MAKFEAKAGAKKGPGLIQRSRGVSPASKAAWNHPTRKFFGLTAKEQSDLETFVGRRIDVNLQSTTA